MPYLSIFFLPPKRFVIQALRGSNLTLKKVIVVYLGDKRLKVDDIDVIPVNQFLSMLWAGEIIPNSSS